MNRGDAAQFVEESRLIKMADGLDSDSLGRLYEFGMRFELALRLRGEPLLITDPTYLGISYNMKRDDTARFVQTYGAIAQDFGGEVSCPVWYRQPYVVLPTSKHYFEGSEGKHPPPHFEFKTPAGAVTLARKIFCDSSALLFLPLPTWLPSVLREKVHEVQRNNFGATIRLPEGAWRLYFEQWKPPHPAAKMMYRNVILKWEGPVEMAQ